MLRLGLDEQFDLPRSGLFARWAVGIPGVDELSAFILDDEFEGRQGGFAQPAQSYLGTRAQLLVGFVVCPQGCGVEVGHAANTGDRLSSAR